LGRSHRRRQAGIFAAPHTQLRKGLWQPSLTTLRLTPTPAEFLLSPQKRPSRDRYKAEIGRIAGNKRPAGCVGIGGGERRFQPTVSNKDDHLMNTRSRIALGVSAALVSLSF